MNPLKILCVDDQRLVHRMEETLLAEYVRGGAKIIHAYDGLEALKRLTEHADIDLILLDINMPVLNGLAFLEQKQKTPYAGVPVIVITSEGEQADEVRHALALGATVVLPKPFGWRELDERIRAL